PPCGGAAPAAPRRLGGAEGLPRFGHPVRAEDAHEAQGGLEPAETGRTGRNASGGRGTGDLEQPRQAILFGYDGRPFLGPRGIEDAHITGGIDIAQPRDDSGGDRKSTRLNSSHVSISYAVFCLKKK